VDACERCTQTRARECRLVRTLTARCSAGRICRKLGWKLSQQLVDLGLREGAQHDLDEIRKLFGRKLVARIGERIEQQLAGIDRHDTSLPGALRKVDHASGLGRSV